VPELLAAAARSAGRYLTVAALILQVASLWGCSYLIKEPYHLSVSFQRHSTDYDSNKNGDDLCQSFGSHGGGGASGEGSVSLADGALADPTYRFAQWMTYLATIFGLVAVFSDCAVLTCCPCKSVRTRPAQIRVVGGMQMVVGIMLGLSFSVMRSAFCTEPWPDLDALLLTNGTLPGEGGDSDGAYSCRLAWGGVCTAVATALWMAAAFLTLAKGRRDRLEEAERERTQADAEAQKTLRRGGEGNDDAAAAADGGGGGGDEMKGKEAAVTNEEIEGI